MSDFEDDSLLQLVNEKAQMENVGAALEDFAEENDINRGKFINQQLKPFPVAIELADPEVQLVSLLCFMLSLSGQQLFWIQDSLTQGLAIQVENSTLNATDSFGENERYSNRLVFITNQFLESLDEIQLRLMNLAKFAYASYTEMLDLMKPIEALVKMIQFEAPILFSISTDEESL